MMTSPLSRRRFVVSGAAAVGLAVPASVKAATDLMATPRQSEGPFYPDSLPLDTDNDLVSVGGRSDPAMGIVTHVFGRVRDRRGQPIAGARIEIWQCDALGRYIHSGDARRGPRDSNFQGFGRAVSEADGGYRFRTIKPVPYPGRTPHIHFAVQAGNFRRLITQMYIEGEPLNQIDMLLRRVRDPARRRALIVPLAPVPAIEADALGGRFDIVLADG